MKGTLLKEFYLWKATRLPLLFLVILGAAFSVVSKSTTLTVAPLFLMIASAAACFSEDKRTAWADYSRCLPNTAAQRVTAKYIFALSEVMIGVLFSLLTTLQSVYHTKEVFEASANEALPYIIDVSYGKTLANHLIYAVLFAVGFSVLVPLSYKMKPRKGEKVNYVLFAVYFLGVAIAGGFVALTFAFSFLKFGFSIADVLCGNILLDVMLAVVIVASVTASWFVCVWLESINNTSARKKLQIKAVVFACVAAVALCAAVGLFVRDVSNTGGFINEEYLGVEDNVEEDYPEPEKIDVPKAKPKECKEKMFAYIDAFCVDGYNNELSLADFDSRINEFGAVKVENSLGSYYMKDGTLSIMIRDELGTDKLVKITVSAQATQPQKVKEATDISLKEYTEQFYEGMPEKELIAQLKILDLCPTYVTEEPQDLIRKYKVSFEIKKFNYDKSAECIITICTQNGVVTEVEYTAF